MTIEQWYDEKPEWIKAVIVCCMFTVLVFVMIGIANIWGFQYLFIPLFVVFTIIILSYRLM